MPEARELTQIIIGAKKPLTDYEVHTKNNGFVYYIPNMEKFNLEDEVIEVEEKTSWESSGNVISLSIPPEIKQLVLLSYEINKMAQEGGQKPRMSNSRISMLVNDEGICYINGGILVDDTETSEKLSEYFDVRISKSPWFNISTRYKEDRFILMLRYLGHAVQFIARGSEWSSSSGYAHMCAGHVPYASNSGINIQSLFSRQSLSAMDASPAGRH